MNILVTGGLGYIGSHACIELLLSGYKVTVLDNISNSHPEVLKRVEKITGKAIEFVQGDIRDQSLVERLLNDYNCSAVMHFAGLKAVGESVNKPLDYYDNNVVGTLTLLSAMQKCGVDRIVFSSSATVYGEPKCLPLQEDHPLSATNPYGRSKIMIEDILRDIWQANSNWRIAILRYFNPVGAHKSGLIGEDPQGIPNNLMPIVAQVAVGKFERLSVWGNDYPTHDGTGVRDYIHVVDLALGHIKALSRLTEPQCLAINLGTGNGSSVLELINTFESASGQSVPYCFGPRRVGDVITCYADPTLANQLLDWKAERDLFEMCADQWRWQFQNPKGYS